jgi:hypothetical protein
MQLSGSKPEITTAISQYDSPLQTKKQSASPTFEIPTHLNLTADASKRLDKKMKEKEDYARLISDVYK